MFVRSHSTESAGAPATAEDEEDFLDLADEYSMLLQSFPLYVTLQAMGQKDMVRHLARSMEAVMRFVPSDGAPTATYLGLAPAAGSVSPAAVTVPPSLKYLSFAIGPELLPGAGADPLAGAHLTKALYGKLVREAAAGAPWAALTLELQSQPAVPDGRGVFIRLDPCRPSACLSRVSASLRWAALPAVCWTGLAWPGLAGRLKPCIRWHARPHARPSPPPPFLLDTC